jgi:molecular chaperone GrpE
MVKKTKAAVKEENNKDDVELKNQLIRALADYDNLKKRIEKEQEGMIRFAGMSLVIRLLPIVDMLEQAQNHLSDPGLAITIKEFKDVLRQDGVAEIAVAVGDKFDENLCEAIESFPGTAENNQTIAEIALKGYKYNDGPVLRHAKVKVFKIA